MPVFSVFRKAKSLFLKSKRNFSKIPAVRPEPKQVFNDDFIKGLKFLSRVRLGLNQLPGHKCRHNF